MSIPNSMVIALGDIERKLDKEDPIKERLKQAMRLARNHWLITDEDQQFRCAIGAVAVTATQEERMILKLEMDFLRTLSAGASGIPIDLEALFSESPKNPYGLRGLWAESNMGES